MTDATDSVTGEPLADFDMALEHGWDGSAALGLYIGKFRVETQYTFQENDIDTRVRENGTKEDASGSLKSNLFMLNAYYDIPVADHLSVYVGGGAGAVYAVFEADSASLTAHQKGTSFAYQVMLGAEYELNPMMSVFAGYRAWSALDFDASNSTEKFPWFHSAEAGLRISF